MSRTTDIISLTEQFGANNYHPLPVVLTRGSGEWVWDVEGNRYLDCLSAYSAVNQGHCHPHIVAAAKAQLDRLTLTSRAFHNDKLGEFQDWLAAICGKDAVLPMNSGAEAVETAIKVARKWAHTVKLPQAGSRLARFCHKLFSRTEIIVFKNNFHGRTTTIVGFSSEEQYRFGFGPFTPGFRRVPYGDIDAVRKAIKPNTAAVLVEPIQGEGGVIVPPEGFLRGLRELCDTHNVLLIADEIQTGLGRTGAWFCCDHEGVEPDIYILGKALSGGLYPISAIAANRPIMDVLNPGDHGSTYGGNPLAAAIGIAALEVLRNEHLPQRAKEMGDYFMEQLRTLRSLHIKEVRGKGLLIGVELRPEAGPARPFCERLLQEGILCKETHESVIRFAPPLTITRETIDWAMERIRRVLED